MKGSFPSFIRKTDQERIQNMLEVLDSPYLYQMTTKLDGSSMTVYWNESQMGVCSRNIDLKLDQEGNTFVDTAKRIFGERVFDGLAIQGELMGPGVQGNRENLTQHEFFVFDIWDIYEQRYRSTAEVTAFCGQNGLRHVPVLNGAAIIEGLTLDDLLEEADNTKSLNHPVAEGIVFKRIDGGESFKVISNKFLLGEK
jgi:RNA ligase (TIGR02306 family)